MPRVVVIDDSPPIVALLKHGLEQAGCAVAGAGTAAEGMDAIRALCTDAVVLDLEMHPNDGIWCLARLRGDPLLADLPVIMISAHPVRDIILRAAKFNIQGIVVKDQHLAAEVVNRVGQLNLHAQAPVEEGILPIQSGLVTTLNSPPAPGPFARAPVFERSVTRTEDEESLASSVLQLDGEGLDIEAATLELKQLKPMMGRSELLELVEDENLRAMKPAVQRVLSLTGSSGASLEAIAQAIKQDQALSLKVLKIANSPVYSRGDRVETVQKAVSRIGIEQIRTTVLSLGVIDRFGSVGLTQRIKPDWFWEHSIACGLIASSIAQMRHQRPTEVDAMFTAGLLHDVGRSIYAERLSDQYSEVIRAADRLELPLETVESRLLLVNHADLTDRLLRRWNFAHELINPIALHHLSVGNIRRVAPRMAESVATLGLANRMAHAMLLGGSGNEVLYPIEEFVQFLGLSRENLASLVRSIPDQTQDMKLQMMVHGAAESRSLLDETRESFPVAPRPVLVTLHPGTDAAAVLLGRLADTSQLEGPNIVVLRVTKAQDRAPLMSRLKAAEQDAGVCELPTLVVASGVGCFFADGSLGDRVVEQVVMPLRLSRFVRAIHSLLDSKKP